MFPIPFFNHWLACGIAQEVFYLNRWLACSVVQEPCTLADELIACSIDQQPCTLAGCLHVSLLIGLCLDRWLACGVFHELFTLADGLRMVWFNKLLLLQMACIWCMSLTCCMPVESHMCLYV